MADRYLLESSAVDGYLLEDGTGVLLLDAPTIKVIAEALTSIEALLRPLAMHRVGIETLELVETTIRTRSLSRVVNEVLQHVETVIRSSSIVRVISETLQSVEDFVKKLVTQGEALVKIMDETLHLLEIAETLGDTLVKIISEAISFVEGVVDLDISKLRKRYKMVFRVLKRRFVRPHG